ncbi:cell wall-associated NlpC family hydrolase [Paenibacillus anaericanus]|uniref:C40 family peptidase n=1 Tax=Paenibacillus anaericanus TaxID=170367 RepID=UPI002789DC48|nr:C40 family peptidase [Paenibacillus anaericanus]MDQ0087764.1 cell wall-associated NlpC family hydrolase [Paenibacillus anaericanus]
MKIQKVFQKILTVGIVSTIGFTTLLASGAGTVQAQSIVPAAESTASQSVGSQVVKFGKQFIGTPYEFGASTTTTRVFDCSSFMKYIFNKYGVTLPRTSAAQAKEGYKVSKANLQVGDLVFFSSGSRSTGSNITHVAVYAGDGKILHTYGAPGVTLSDLDSANWKKTYVTARRVL